MPREKRVLVTGCSGYVGKQLLTLLSDYGYQVTGTCRRNLEVPGVKIHRGDLADFEFVQTLVESHDVIVHSAAVTRSSDPRVLYDGNEKPTSSLLNACRAHPGKLFIYLSSDQAALESNPYGKSKRECEKLVEQSGVGYAILRLSPVLGNFSPAENSTFSKIIAKVAKGPFVVIPGNGHFPIAPIFIGDIAKIVSAIIELPHPLNQVFGLQGSETTLADFLSQVEERLKVHRRRICLPLAPLKGIARILKQFPFFGRLPLDGILQIGNPLPISNSKTAAQFGFFPTAMSQVLSAMKILPNEIENS